MSQTPAPGSNLDSFTYDVYVEGNYVGTWTTYLVPDRVQQQESNIIPDLDEIDPGWVDEDFNIPSYHTPRPWIPVPFVPTGQPNLYADDSDLTTTEEVSVDSDSDPDFGQIDFSEEINLNDLYF